MEAMLKKRSVSKYSKVYSTEFTGESSTETVVPDVLPDISEILCATGTVLLRSKTTEDGKASLSASVSASVVYSPESETGLNSLHLTLPFEAEAESSEITSECRTVTQIKLVSIDARMINTRKVSVRAEVLVSIECYALDMVELVEDIDAPAEASLHVKRERTDFSIVSDVREKTFVISDEYILPSGSREIREILSPSSEIIIDDIKVLGSKLVMRGSSRTELLCSCGDESALEQVSFSTNFSQMMEMEDIGEDPDTSYRLMLTAAYYEPVITAENRCTVSMELHLVAQAICSRVESCETVTDMYSNKCDCSFETDNCDTYLVLRRQTLRTTVREVIKTPVPPAELLYMRAQVSSISGTTARITIVGLYTDEEGNCRALKGSLTAEFETELDENMSLIADCAYVTEVFASPTDEGVELKIPVEMEAVIIKKQTLCIPMQPELCEKQDTCDAPSLVLIPASACTDLWQVAKKYASTPELISKANSCQEEGAEAAMLLIPREP